MKFKTFLIKDVLICFFVVWACVSAAIGILGSIFVPEARFGYEAFLSPLIIAAISMLPSFATYTKKELTEKQMLFRLVIHWVLLEAVVMTFGYFTGLLFNPAVTVAIAASVLIIDVTANIVLWLNDRATAQQINAALKKLQSEALDAQQ